MSNFNDFDLDVAKKTRVRGEEPQWKSKSLCTPGCVTGVLQTCSLRTATCGCHISK
ncbi:MAG: gallidermin/nisin family lantibiotic [Inconstantimicrobium porci]|uniref:gallidermin/nisin family lantibiotic n=1 Tax=Inconstantimicrobium porci TaxID=2652291 RepID=UPI0024095182|nr:gallidermin/nisin family lantibiotic [Inconstantimicrobium porci]MDD6770173.1 gallidermin/nisin family lantibiotic [Inconstantimicrobium porci]MDY5912932.1 gallidermin/nisin family lantibiotic [Inconstantimicrobium porci]